MHSCRLHRTFREVKVRVYKSEIYPHDQTVFVQIMLLNGHRNMTNVQILYYCVFPFLHVLCYPGKLSFLKSRGTYI